MSSAHEMFSFKLKALGCHATEKNTVPHWLCSSRRVIQEFLCPVILATRKDPPARPTMKTSPFELSCSRGVKTEANKREGVVSVRSLSNSTREDWSEWSRVKG